MLYVYFVDCANLSANFPELYQREDGLYPDKPSLFDLIPIEEKWTSSGKEYMYPGVNVTFKVPPNGMIFFFNSHKL